MTEAFCEVTTHHERQPTTLTVDNFFKDDVTINYSELLELYSTAVLLLTLDDVTMTVAPVLEHYSYLSHIPGYRPIQTLSFGRTLVL